MHGLASNGIDGQVDGRRRDAHTVASYEPATDDADDAEVFPPCPTGQDGSIAPSQAAIGLAVAKELDREDGLGGGNFEF